MAPSAITTPNLLSDPGYLFYAPLGTAEPTHAVTASKFSDTWPVGWLQLGATAEGSTFSYELSVEAISVAELFDPVKYATTARSGSLSFALADWTATNLKRALNGGTITVTGATTTTMSTYTLPTPGNEVRSMIGWESQDNTVRIIVFQAISSGTLEMAFQKAPEFARIPMTWNFEVPSGSSNPFKVITAGTLRG